MNDRKMEKHGSDDECPSQVELRDCLEELVKFTLYSHSHIDNLTLSTQYCSTLLKDDPTQPCSSLGTYYRVLCKFSIFLLKQLLLLTCLCVCLRVFLS